MMAEFIAQRIIDAREISLEEGQKKYKAYFVTLKLYRRYQATVDAILEMEGCADCIVTA